MRKTFYALLMIAALIFAVMSMAAAEGAAVIISAAAADKLPKKRVRKKNLQENLPAICLQCTAMTSTQRC